MRLPRFLLLWIVLLSAFASYAQTSDTARDLVLPAVDPRTFDAGENCDLYLIRSDGSRVVNLTDTEFDSENKAVWSADGRRLYFSRNSVGRYTGYTELQSSTSFYAMDISEEGENLGERLLFRMSDVFDRPVRVEAWVLSPDEQTIAFIPYPYYQSGGAEIDGVYSLYIIAADGSNLRRLLLGNALDIYAENLHWSPDGEEIAFRGQVCTVDHYCHGEYFTVRPRSLSTPERIGSERDLMRRWNSGAVVAAYEPPNVVVLDTEGDNVFSAAGFHPALSPDGSTLVYEYFDHDAGTGTLISVPLDEVNHARPLTPAFDNGGIWYPRWSPDGEQIAFLLRNGGSSNVTVYRVNADGSDLAELHYARMWEFTPVEWRPDWQQN